MTALAQLHWKMRLGVCRQTFLDQPGVPLAYAVSGETGACARRRSYSSLAQNGGATAMQSTLFGTAAVQAKEASMRGRPGLSVSGEPGALTVGL